jgi:ribonuclease HII
VSKNVEDDLMEMNVFELASQQKGYKQIAGIDEAGRGALAGPVIAAAVILPINCGIKGLRDSKQLSPKQRAYLFDEIHDVAVSVGIGAADHRVIDHLNILQATLLAMREAVEKLTPAPDYVLVDGSDLPEVGIVGEAIPKGDNKSYSIAAASIIAKVTRDRLMAELDPIYPNYGFSRHKGYPTSQHRQAIAQFGTSEIHRRTFKLLPDA